MNKKILIGCIITVAILIGVSFTSVVGYSSVKPDVKASPLFAVRTKRAIDKESRDLTCDYVGKGEGTNIYLPEINNDSESIDVLINAIRRMDDISLRRLTSLIIYQIHQTDDFQELNYKEIYLSLKQLRDSPDSVIQDVQQREGSVMMSNICTAPFCPSIAPYSCIILFLLVLIDALIGIILGIIYYFFCLFNTAITST